MPYIDEYYAAQQPRDADIPQPMGYQPDASAVTGAGRANIEGGWRERTEDWINRNLLSGGATDIRNMAAAAAGPAVQAAGGLGRVLNWGSRAGIPAKAPAAIDAADQMFDVARAAPVMRAQAGSADPRVLAALGAAVPVGLGALYGYMTSPEEQPTPPPNAGVGVSAPVAARVIRSRADRIEAATDASTLPPAQFKAKWGGLPEQVLTQ